MAIFVWNDLLSVGVPEFDAQHKKLFGMMNALHDAMAKGQGREILKPILDGLVDYTQTHFAAEERRMQQCGYPAYLQHKVQHDALVRKVNDLKKRFEAGQSTLTVEILNFLKDWLVNHIQGTDKKYAPFLSAHAAAAR